ncbi:MAG: AzlD domain-containing protein [Lachnospiraceae bacterium]|nr:AzlD domain-containing protein [Lachnospiraceae bacterium]
MSRDLIMIIIMAAVTIALRFLPFLVFGGSSKTPEFITYLGKVLPFSIMGMLVIYCLRDVDLLEGSHGIPELLSVALIMILHKWKRNTLLSIIAGTACYMLLIQFVFL